MKLNSLFYALPLLFFILLLIFNSFGKLEPITFNSVLYGFLIASLSFAIGFISIKIGLDKSDKTFLIVVFGGVILRLFVVLMLIILSLNFLFVSLNSFIFTAFIFYFYYLIVEIYILSQKKNIKIKTKNG